MAKDMVEPPATGAGQVRKIQHLVNLQNELIALAQKNEQAQKHCAALWRELERQARRAPRPGRLAAQLARLRQRLVSDLFDRVSAARTRENLMRPTEH
jgi:hypothetical protein